jgi:hypothetical protein
VLKAGALIRAHKTFNINGKKTALWQSFNRTEILCSGISTTGQVLGRMT